MTIFAIGANINQLSEFIDVFGMRFTGLIDPSSAVYSSWRVPQPLAPYPQDYVIDQQGVVRYWSDQFDPQAAMAVIDRLLGTGVAEEPPVTYGPRPTAGIVEGALNLRGDAAMALLLDATGREVMELAPGSNDVGHLSPGVYFVSRAGAGRASRVVVLR